MVVTFCGHREPIYNKSKIFALRRAIEKVINNGATEFWLGGYGSFDLISASILQDLKNTNSSFKTVFITPYVDRIYDMDLYDFSLYPPIEHIPLKFAITERNKWMIRNADILISGVIRSYGGAAKALNYAKHLGKDIISVYDNNEI